MFEEIGWHSNEGIVQPCSAKRGLKYNEEENLANQGIIGPESR
jgi:hypothetical protein